MTSLSTRFSELPSDTIGLICIFTGKFKYDKNGELQSIINIYDYIHIDFHLQEVINKRSLRDGYYFNHNIIFIYRTRQYHWPKRDYNPVITNEPINIINHRTNPKTDRVKKNQLRPNYKKNFRRLV